MANNPVTLNQPKANQGGLDGKQMVNGRLYQMGAEVDGLLWVPATEFFFPDGTWTLTRDGTGLYRMLKTAGAATTHVIVNLSDALGLQKYGADPSITDDSVGSPNQLPGGGQPHQIRGAQLQAVALYYKLLTANLTSMTPAFWRNVFVDQAAQPTPASIGGTLAPTVFPVVANAVNVNVKVITLGTPFIVGNNDLLTKDTLEITIVDPGTAVLSLYGIDLRFNYDLL